MIEHLPELLEAGITSLKIEGRAKFGLRRRRDHQRRHATRSTARSRREEAIGRSGGSSKKRAQGQSQVVQHRFFFLGGELGQSYEDGGHLRGMNRLRPAQAMRTVRRSSSATVFSGRNAEVLEPCARHIRFGARAV